MVDLQETPAVPEEAYGGDERWGLEAAGVTLVVLGWVLGVALNLWLHLSAPSTGTVLGPVVIHHALGDFAWATLLIGAMTGAIGVVIAWVARESPKGPLVLPGGVY